MNKNNVADIFIWQGFQLAYMGRASELDHKFNMWEWEKKPCCWRAKIPKEPENNDEQHLYYGSKAITRRWVFNNSAGISTSWIRYIASHTFN